MEMGSDFQIWIGRFAVKDLLWRSGVRFEAALTGAIENEEMSEKTTAIAQTVKRLSVTTAVSGFGLLSSLPCLWLDPIARLDVRRKVG
ncbi:hypothetical protein ACLOJK_037444 [Asimina triloba]